MAPLVFVIMVRSGCGVQKLPDAGVLRFPPMQVPWRRLLRGSAPRVRAQVDMCQVYADRERRRSALRHINELKIAFDQ